MRPNSRSHDPFAPHRAAPVPQPPRTSRRRGGRRKRTQVPVTRPEQQHEAVEPVAPIVPAAEDALDHDEQVAARD